MEEVMSVLTTCNRCKELLGPTCFSSNGQGGRRTTCRSCVADYNKVYREKNKDDIAVQRKQYRRENREKIAEYNLRWRQENPDYDREWRRTNPDKASAIRRRWYIKNGNQGRSYARQWYWSNLEKARERNRLWSKTPRGRAVTALWRDRNREKRRYQEGDRRDRNGDAIRAYQRKWSKTPTGRALSAKRNHQRRSRVRQTDATLTREQWQWIIEKQKGRCLGCRRKFAADLPPTRDHITPVSSGGGLTVQNTVALCVSCNSSKGDREPEYIAQRGLL